MEQDLYLHGLIKAVPVETPAWTRPTDWLTVPDLNPLDDKIYLLVNIIVDSPYNHIAFICTGNYTVNWGDGNIENVASGVKAQHIYDVNDISPSTLTSEGYRQVLVTITPNGGSLLTVQLGKSHSSLGVGKQIQILEVKFNCPNVTTFRTCQGWGEDGVYSNLQRIVIGENNISNMNYFSSVLYNLREVIITSELTQVTTAYAMFFDDQRLVNVQIPETALSNCTDFGSMFDSCFALIDVPLFDTSSGLDFTGMFSNSTSLSTVPLFDTSSATTLNYMFGNCTNLSIVPLFNTPLCVNFGGMFTNCHILPECPEFNLSSATNIASMFNGCELITRVPAYDISNVTSINSFVLTGGIIEFAAIGLSINYNFAGALLDRTNIVNLFNNLASGVVAKTITVTGNPGVPDLTAPDLAIATSKGWSVVT